ncbi:MAG: acylase [Rhizomicrobium sp.]|jgi:penicillin amidase/acyl-homoserine-lactone acylase
MRYLKIGGIALLVIVLAGLGFVIVSDRIAQPAPPDPAILIAKAARYDVHIVRDNFGVPHVFGHRDVDVAFGFAFAHSEDDFATIQDVALATRGQLAATEGVKAAMADYIVHLLRVWDTVNARYEKYLPADVRAVAEAYADGVNYYAAIHPDKVKPGLLPLTGKDIAAGFVFKTPFFYGLDETLKEVNDPPSTARGPEVGSNGAAVAPSRSADGATRLLVNSHQPYTGPVAWYEAVLQSDEGWHVAGGFFPGTPFMLHGHNEHLGWANTVNAPNLANVYKLTINPANDNQYLLDGKWRDIEKTDAAIRVKIFGPLIWTVHRPVYYSAQGPVLKTDHGVFAIRYAGMGEVRQMLQYYRLNKASNLEQWRAAMALQALPSINYVYADEKGNIGYVYNGQFPVRKKGIDWKHVLPGDRSDLIWHGYLPFDKVPQLWNPKSGFVFNSNNTPFQATAPADDLKPQDFSPTLGIQTDMTNRAYRALENFGTDTAITAAAFRKYKFDLAYSTRSDIAHLVARLVTTEPGTDADLKQALGILRHWDRMTNVADRGTALAILTGEPVLHAREEKETPIDPLVSLQAAIKTLKEHFGRLDPSWGEVNRIRRGTLDLAIDGGPDTYRAVYGTPQPDGTLMAGGGDTFIMFVTWDKAGKLSSESVHQFGSATLDSHSPHYADQTPLFVAMKTKPVLFTRAQLAGHIEADYRPGERRAIEPNSVLP